MKAFKYIYIILDVKRKRSHGHTCDRDRLARKDNELLEVILVVLLGRDAGMLLEELVEVGIILVANGIGDVLHRHVGGNQ